MAADGLQTINEANEMGFLKTVMDKANTGGIKVDLTTPTYGWRDIEGPVTIELVGPTSPSYETFQGVQQGYAFSVNDIMQHRYHIPHDYAANSDLFIHIHWACKVASIVSGAPTFSCKVSYAKGHNQAAYSADITTVDITENASGTQYQHMLTQIQLSAVSPSANQLDSNDIEPDGIIKMVTELTANTISPSADPFIDRIDIHYQSTNIGTKSNSPNFYT
jgi:hypothetical protein